MPHIVQHSLHARTTSLWTRFTFAHMQTENNIMQTKLVRQYRQMPFMCCETAPPAYYDQRHAFELNAVIQYYIGPVPERYGTVYKQDIQ